MLTALRPLLSAAEQSLLAAGWKGGRVEQVLAGMAARRELWARTRRRMRSRLLLPLAVLLIASLVAPLPRYFAGGGAAGYLFSALAPLAVAFLLWRAGVFLLQARARRREARVIEGLPADRLLLELPVVGEIERQMNLAEFAGLLGLLSGAGVPLNAALEACARAAPSSVYARGLMRCAGSIGQGRPLSSALLDESLWPAPFVSAVVVGEKSGALEATLLRLGNEAREEHGRAVEKLGEWAPKVVYALVALFVIWQIFQLFLMVAGLYEGALH